MWSVAGENASEGVVDIKWEGDEGGMGMRPSWEPGWETTGMQVKSALTDDFLYFPWTTAPVV